LAAHNAPPKKTGCAVEDVEDKTIVKMVHTIICISHPTENSRVRYAPRLSGATAPQWAAPADDPTEGLRRGHERGADLLLKKGNSVIRSVIGNQLERHEPGQQVRWIELTDKIE
jgi:hypothetical protein